jgi:hypothetical protein
MTHDPSHHVTSTAFPADVEQGIAPPDRRNGANPRTAVVAPSTVGLSDLNTIMIARAGLRIVSPSREEPAGYTSGEVIRPAHTARGIFAADEPNVLFIRAAETPVGEESARPLMPSINVEVQCSGFDPAHIPLRWRLQVGHTFCRYSNAGSFRYSPVSHRFTAEWQGEAHSGRFTLFDEADRSVRFTFGSSTDSPVGGHGILTIAARLPGAADWLVDHAHLLIGGKSPDEATARAGITSMLADRHEHIRHMVMAIFAHESSFRQFRTAAISSASRTFGRNQHRGDATQADCAVTFRFPGDPAHFPLVSYDFGVGISQYTVMRGQELTAGVLWDWRENYRAGINVFMAKMRRSFENGQTWRQLALRAWEGYNGSGASAQAYARRLARNADGQLVLDTALPSTFDHRQEFRNLDRGTPQEAPPPWPE